MERFGLKKLHIMFVVCVATATASPATTFKTLHSFSGTDGINPYVGLVQGSDGNIYGTTYTGGANGSGTVFKITSSGMLKTLYSFCAQTRCADGGFPYAPLVQASDGNFYGTTSFTGSPDNGTVFKITPEGALTTLYTFETTHGAIPLAGLIQASDGNLYGTTGYGGANNQGTIFKITLSGVLTTLYSFCPQTGCPDGAVPTAGLIQASDGDLYGTTYSGGASGSGTVFKISTGGTLTTLHSFGDSDGANPNAALVQAIDGNFYGTTSSGGTTSHGTIFKITAAGTLTTLYKFDYTDGAEPFDGLIQGADGNLYGTSFVGGAHGNGTIFEITLSGALTTLHSFAVKDGSNPLGGLIQTADGTFYGTTMQGGTSGDGTIFTFGPATAIPSPSPFNFGMQPIHTTSAAGTVTLKNSGTPLLGITGITINGDFAISTNTCGSTLPGGKSCKVNITFTPTALGNRTGTLTFTDNAANNPQTVTMLGIGVEPVTLTPSSATYAAQTVGTTSAAKTFTLTNNQTAMLIGITISTTGDFAVSATTCTRSLLAKDKCTISVTFRPQATGTRTGQLRVNDSSSNSPQTSNLRGTGK